MTRSPRPRPGYQSAFGYCRRVAEPSRAELALAAGPGAVSALCGVGLLATSGWLITRASERPPVLSLCVAIGAVQAFSLGRGVFRYFQRVGVHRCCLDVLGRLRLHLYDTVVPLVPGGLGREGPGAVLSGFVSDTEVVAEGLAKATTSAVEVGASILFGTILVALVDPVLGALVAIGSAAVVALSFWTARSTRLTETRIAGERGALAGTVVESVLSAPELVAYGREDIVQARLDEVRRRSARLELRRAWHAGLARCSATAAAGGVLVAVVAAGLLATGRDAASSVFSTSAVPGGQGRVTGVLLAVVVFATLAVIDQCAGLPAALAGTKAAGAAAGRLRRLEGLRPPAGEPEASMGRSRRDASARLEGVATSAPDGLSVLKDVSLEVAPGEHVALVGPSGSGKTSAVYALLRFVACSAGRASLGGADVAELSRQDIASIAGWAPDEAHIFSASLRENLRLAKPSADDASCEAALKRAGLGPWYAALPDGLGTALGTGGRPLSAGERQRIALARLLLAGLPVLLLDEPTARLDPCTSAQVLAELLGAASDRSVLFVSHEPGTSELADKVVALAEGRVVAVSPGQRRVLRPGPGAGLRPSAQ